MAKRVFKWYLILVIIYSVCSILMGVVLLKLNPDLVLNISKHDFFTPLWLLFSIVMLIVLIIKKIEKIALWIPSLDLAQAIIVGIIGFFIGFTNPESNIEIMALTIAQNPVIFSMNLIFPLVILIIAIKLLIRK